MSNPFQKATRRQSFARVGMLGPSGSGKTWNALTLATALGRTAVIDTEHGSAAKYADRFSFDTIDLLDHDPRRYMEMIAAAEEAGYQALVIDSLTHAWDATKRLVDQETTRSKSGNSFQAWGKVGHVYADLIARLVASKLHIVATMRSKTEYLIEEDSRGKKVPKKVGTAPQVREGSEYEMDVVLEMDTDNTVWVVKSRCHELSGGVWKKPANEIADILRAWLGSGAPPAVAAPPTIAGSNPDIARPTQKVGEWTAEQKEEGSRIRAELSELGGKAAEDEFTETWKRLKYCPPSDVIDALALLLPKWRDIASAATNTAKG